MARRDAARAWHRAALTKCILRLSFSPTTTCRYYGGPTMRCQVPISIKGTVVCCLGSLETPRNDECGVFHDVMKCKEDRTPNMPTEHSTWESPHPTSHHLTDWESSAVTVKEETRMMPAGELRPPA